MKNPYWSSQGQTHPISIDQIRKLGFEIINIVAASGELAGDSAVEAGDRLRAESRTFQLLLERIEFKL